MAVANDTSLILRSVYYRRPLALPLEELLLEEDDPKLLLEDDLELLCQLLLLGLS